MFLRVWDYSPISSSASKDASLENPSKKFPVVKPLGIFILRYWVVISGKIQ